MALVTPLLHLRLLGPFEAQFHGETALEFKLRSERLLLAWLAVRPRQSGSRAEIAALFWSERSDAQAHQSLRQTLAVLRRSLNSTADHLLKVDREKVSLVTDAVRSDVASLLLLRADSEIEDLERAIVEYRGEFLEGLSVRDRLMQQWLEDQRAQLRVAAIARFEWLLTAYARVGRHSDVPSVAFRLIDLDPLVEEGHRALIRAYLAMGDRAKALQQYQRCQDILMRNLSVDPSEETKALMLATGESRSRVIATGSSKQKDILLGWPKRVHNLPQPMTTLIGREQVVDDVESCLRMYRLVTLTGAGGVGKTRIAIETGITLDGTFTDGVWLVELSSLTDPHLIGEALCGSLGVPVSGDRPAVKSAIAHLHQRQILLILDNCEHLITEAARLAETILAACSSVSILATSREALAVSGEKIYRVNGLNYPTRTSGLSAEALSSYTAVQLFIDRAAALVDQMKLDETTAPAIASICQQVEGIPLAIELAVARLKMMRPERLAAELNSTFFTLRRSARTGLKHHETLRTMLDWSYDLLQPNEQAFLRRLGVFAGGCSLASAVQVTRGQLILEDEVFDLLSSLVEKSLLTVDLSGVEPRYRLLETTRQYALYKQREDGESDRQQQLAEYLIGRFGEASQSWARMPTATWLGRYEPELDNLRASLEWAFGIGGDLDIGLELASLSIRLWDEHSLFREKERWVETAMVHVHETSPAATAAQLFLARTSNSAHGDQSSFSYAEHAVRLFRSIGRTLDLGEALARAGASLLTMDTIEQSLPYLDVALSVLEPLGSTKPLASCLRSKGVAAYLGGDIDAAKTWIGNSMAVCRSIGDSRGVSSAQIALAEMDFIAGKIECAIEAIRYMLDGTGYNHRQAVLGLSNLAAYLLAFGNMDKAREAASESLRIARALGWKAAVVRAGEHLALIGVLGGEIELAAQLAGYARAFYEKGGASREWTEEVTHQRLIAELSRQLSPTRLDDLIAQGEGWSEQQALEAAEIIGERSLGSRGKVPKY